MELVPEGEFFKFIKGEVETTFSPENAYQYFEARNPDSIKNLPAPISVNENALTTQESQGVRNLVKKIDEFNLDDSQLSILESELKKIIEYSNVKANAIRERNRVDALKQELGEKEDYLNAVKLLTQFSKFNYMDKNGYGAIIIEENRKYETDNAANKNLREYKIIDIQRVDDKQ